MQFVDLKAQHDSLEPELSAAIARVIRDSAFVRSADVDEFERRFAVLIEAPHCVSCANGTDAIYIALRALGAGPGDEVITTAHSWMSTSETVTQSGARVVFADTEDAYFTIDPADIERKITSRTKGIIPVHLYGQMADMPRIMEIARRHNLWVIEDSAQAHLARQDGALSGHFGDAATFSFYPGKNLGAMGDAGCLVTRRDEIAEFAALFARHGGKNDHQIEGICSRMDGLQAAILNVKMRALVGWNKRRQELAARYDRLLAGIPGLVVPARRANCEHVYHLYVIRYPARDRLRARLEARKIPTGIHYPKPLPLYRAYAYLGHSEKDFPIAARHAREILSLPMHPFLTEAEQDEVVAAIAAFKPD
jgi:dTDP-4-amino-4,6-dideoxygalactose transaminase